MWTESEIEIYLKKTLKDGRFRHSLSVRDTAVTMAKKFGADVDKARLAGLIHDCAKNLKDEEIIELAVKKVTLDEVTQNTPQLLHGYAGAVLAEEKFGIEDVDVLQAVCLHTTGKKNMTKLDKIIYLADYVEPLRDFAGVDELRKLSQKDLDKALLKSFDLTINFVLSKGQLLHKDTVEARNYLIMHS